MHYQDADVEAVQLCLDASIQLRVHTGEISLDRTGLNSGGFRLYSFLCLGQAL